MQKPTSEPSCPWSNIQGDSVTWLPRKVSYCTGRTLSQVSPPAHAFYKQDGLRKILSIAELPLQQQEVMETRGPPWTVDRFCAPALHRLLSKGFTVGKNACRRGEKESTMTRWQHSSLPQLQKDAMATKTSIMGRSKTASKIRKQWSLPQKSPYFLLLDTDNRSIKNLALGWADVN